MKKYSLVKTFTLTSLITFILIGVVLVFVISEHVKKDYHNNLYGVAQIAVEDITENIITKSEFSKTITESKNLRIEESVNRSLSLYMPRSFVLYNKQKQIISTNRPSEDDLVSYESTGFDKILQNNVSYYISKAYTLDDLRKTRVFNLYVPIKYDSEIAGVLLLQIPEIVINSHVNMLVKEIVLTMAGGLGILFLLLIRIMYSASKTLRNQNNKLLLQKDEIELAYKKLSDSYRNTILALSNAVDARDSYTAGHSERVTKISLLIGKQLGLDEEEQKKLEYAALFHDIGKIGIPDHILLKNGKLTDEEYVIIKKHPEMGASILKSINFLDDILPIIKHHHEQYLGKGYPDKMKGEEIPFNSRIIAVADTYDAMTSDRPYRKKLPHKIAVEEILTNRQIQFDGIVVDAFMAVENNIDK